MEKYDVDITIKRLTDWKEVKDSTLVTVHKKAIEGKPISSEWKTKMVISEHSPIRDLFCSILLQKIPRFLADELVRHTQGTNWKMGTWREDRIKKPRSEQHMDDLTVLKVDLNAQAFINISQKRMCVGCASPHIIKLWMKVIDLLYTMEPELAKVCVPSCIYRGGCPEGFAKCGHFNTFANSLDGEEEVEVLTNIEKRYEAYWEWRE